MTRPGFFGSTVDRPVATLMVVIAIVVFGWVSLSQLPVNLMPEISYPTVTIRTNYEGAAPEEIEDQITEPIEELVGTVEGVVGISSTSRAGSSDVVLQFQWNTDLDFATQKVRERIAMIQFPEDDIRPSVLRYDPTLDPILRIAITGAPLSVLRHYADETLEPALEKLPGVAMVRVLGGEERVIDIALSEERMEAYGIDVDLVRERLMAENINLAGGRLHDGELEYLVRTQNQLEDLGEVRQLVLTQRGDATIRLRDVATVERGVRERQVLTRFTEFGLHDETRGSPTLERWESVELAIYKEADANLVAVAERVRETLEAEGDGPDNIQLPDGVEVRVLSDQSLFIQGAINEVSQSALLGGLCAILVLLFFLRRGYSTVIIAMAIPLSVITVFAPLRFLGITLNIMSLGGLALGVGMLVDNAIVVLESIVRCREEGDNPREAAIRGTREVGGAVIASTLTTVAVFFPIVFVEGIAGQLFGDLAATVVLSLVASLIFALFFVPMLAALPARLTSGLGVGDAAEESTTAAGYTGWVRRFLRRVTRRLHTWTTLVGDTRALFGWVGRGHLVLRPFKALLVLLPYAYVLARTALTGVLEVAARVIGVLALVPATVGVLAYVIASYAYRFTVGLAVDAFVWLLERVTRIYARALAFLLKQRLLVLAVAGGLAFWTAQTYPSLGVQLIPELHQGEYNVDIQWPIGTSLEETAAASAELEGALAELDSVDHVAVFVGVEEDALDVEERGEHTATVTVTLSETRDVAQAEAQAFSATRALLEDVPGIQFTLSRPTFFSMSSPVAVEVRGHDLNGLARTADRVVEAAEGVDGVRHVRSNMRAGFPEVRVTFDRERLAAMGLDARAVAEGIQRRVQGSTPTAFHEPGDVIDIVVRDRDEDVASVDALEELVVGYVQQNSGALDMAALNGGTPTVTRTPIRLRSVASITMGQGPSEIRHIEGERAAVVTAESESVDLAGLNARLEEALVDVEPEPRQLIVVAGQRDEVERSQRALGFAFLLAVFLVYVVMASTFESILAPMVILVTIPLALIGVVGVLSLTGTPISVIALIGVIVLAGIVVNNAIVMVDYIIQRRRAGEGRHEAIVNAASIRLRPVLITATTTILGLIPMAISVGQGAEIRRPLAWVVMAGLAVSTILTLVVIPVVYDLIGEGGWWLGRGRSGASAPHDEAGQHEQAT